MGNPLSSRLPLFLILLSSPVFFLTSCGSVPVDPRPRAFPSFKIQEIKVRTGSRLPSFALRKETYFCCSRSFLLFGYCIDPCRRRRSGGDVPTLYMHQGWMIHHRLRSNVAPPIHSRSKGHVGMEYAIYTCGGMDGMGGHQSGFRSMSPMLAVPSASTTVPLSLMASGMASTIVPDHPPPWGSWMTDYEKVRFSKEIKESSKCILQGWDL
ncbi:hypothetical protein GW17_00062153 [Ensete ventricosum]|nr:hypothetical protein GW17_00062153 [Ensete ventricosum]